jgi:hypothetical protein
MEKLNFKSFSGLRGKIYHNIFKKLYWMVILFLTVACNSKTVSKNTIDASADSLVKQSIISCSEVENFEGYNGILPLAPWPLGGGWMISPYGHIVDAGLDRVVKYEGNYSLRMTYRVGKSKAIAISVLCNPCLKWGDYDAVRLWLQPDGSGRRFTFFVMEKVKEDGYKWFWEAPYDMNGSSPVILTIPFSAFYLENNTKGKGESKPFDWKEIEEIAFWVRLGNGQENPAIPSTIWIDKLEVVKLGKPITHVQAEPAPVNLKNTDSAIRIDYGSEADWTDADGKRWTADMPAKEGILNVASNAIILGTDVQDIYRNARQDVKSLKIPLKNGKYKVILHFAETDTKITGIGQRVFSVAVERSPKFEIDIFRLAGGSNIAFTKSFQAKVEDGELNIQFEQVNGHTIIAALEIMPF